jgi:maltooligosyltrehalose trehalohydrolase
MGEEWGARTPWQFFSRFGDPGLQKAVRDGRRAEFADHGWDDTAEVPDPNAESTFTDSRLDWSEPEQEPHATLLRMHRELIALRRAWPELSDPWLDRIGVDVHEQARTLVVARGRMRVVVNLGPEPVTLSLGSEITRILLASEPTTSDGSSFTVPAEAFAICRVAD